MDHTRSAQFPLIPQQQPPVVIDGTDGVWLLRDNGDRILDAAGGAIVTNVGHRRPDVIAAATEALQRVNYVVPPFATEYRVALIEELIEHWLPDGFTRAAFFSGGSESVDAAVRMARTYHLANGDHDRWKVIGRDVSYHGSTLSGLSVGLHDRRRDGLQPLLADHPKSDWLDPDSVAKVIEREDPSTVSAFIGEPINGASGAAKVPPPGYWRAVEEACRANGVLLIVDEVMTGLGRTGKKWGFEHFDISPDIIVGCKGLSGGYAPMGGMYTRTEIADTLAAAGKSMMYYTYSGSDLGCAVSLKVLQILREEQLVQRAATMGALLRKRLDEELGDHPHVGDIRGLGLMQGIELVKDRDTGEPFPRSLDLAFKVAMEAVDRGVWFYPCGSGPVVDGILFGPPLTITEEHIELIVGVTKDAIDTTVGRL